MVYVVKLALLVPVVFDTGMRNPLDDTPLFNIQTTATTSVVRKTNA